MNADKPVTDYPKCRDCRYRTCLLTVDQVLQSKYADPAKARKFSNLIYNKLPRSLFLPCINLNHRITGKRIIKYEKTADGWIIDYGDYLLNTPRPTWINSTMAHFREEFEVFHKIAPGDVCVDIGSCIGDTTLPMVAETGEKGRVIAVEPMPENIKYLKTNLGRYNYTEIIEKAVSDKNGKMKFYLHDTPTGHSLEFIDERDKGVIEVETMTLNDMFRGRKIDFAKIDVQGYETHILAGQDEFYRNVDKLVIETHGRWLPDQATYPHCLRTLKDYPLEIRFCIMDGVIHCKGGYTKKR